jgi:putative heme-binding domain-containing protein
MQRWSTGMGFVWVAVIGWGLGGFAPVRADEPSAPHWIAHQEVWNKRGDARSLSADLVKWFEIDRPLQSASLRFAADFCAAQVSFNKRPAIAVAPYSPTQSLDVTNFLHSGTNWLRVSQRSTEDRAAIALSLDLRFVDGTSQRLVSDGSWKAESPPGTVRGKTTDLGPVPRELWGLGRRDLSLSAFENYEQWQQSKREASGKYATRFQLPDGFEVTELRTAQPDEGSWIAMAFDPQGRLTISREESGFLRLTLSDDRTSVSKVESVDAPLLECRGLVYDGDTLYANANNSKGLFRLTIDENSRPQGIELLREFPGQVGHGRNDLALAKMSTGATILLSIHGDSVEVPRDPVKDLTSPARETHRLPPKREGTLVRLIPGEKKPGVPLPATLVHAGLRNPYGIALDRFGTPFTFDADNEHDMGTPWYRPTRILQLVTGGDSGYREVTGQLPPRFHDQPDHAPPLFDIGRSSPTSVMFGDKLQFPPEYQRALFALDWTYGRVLAVHFARRGQTYRVAAETFLQGRPLNVTDIATGPDGAMYLITGGRKTQSALYRVRWTGSVPTASPPSRHETESLARHETESLARHETESLERASSNGPATGFDLDTTDPVARHAQRLRLEATATLALESPHDATPLGKLTRLMAAARWRDPTRVPELLDRLLAITPPLAEQNLSEQFVWTRVAGLALETARDTVLARKSDLVTHVVAAWKHDAAGPLRVAPEGTNAELRRRWAYLLGELAADELPALAAPLLLVSSVQEDQLAGLLATRTQRTGWSDTTRKQQLEALAAIPRMIGGAGLPPTEKWLREGILATLTDAERTTFATLLNPQPETPLPTRPRPFVQKWTLADLARVVSTEPDSNDARKAAIDRGRTVFHDAFCAKCHRVGLRGAAVGPDLSHVGRRFSRRDLLESIVEPSRSVAENFRLELIETTDGKTYSGRVIPEGDYRKETLRLALDPLDASKVVEIDKKEIVDHQLQPLSPMPAGLLDTFTLEEIADLLTYLEGGG